MARLSFDLLREAGAVVAHEWRDGGQPYRVGPSLLADADGKLYAGGKAMVEPPAGTWTHVEITCRLGEQSGSRYNLRVTVPGREVCRVELPCGSAEFHALKWLGFVSLATSETTFYLDNATLYLCRQQEPR
jgi:hypothetical protein